MPWYHLGSHTSSRKRPLRVPTHSCAVTCAHVVTYASAVSHATPRPCSASPSVPLSTNRGSLRRICLLTLLFIVFAVLCFLIIYYIVYTLSVLLSTGEMDRKDDGENWKTGRMNKVVKNSVGWSGIGLKGGGKTAIMLGRKMRGGWLWQDLMTKTQ